MSKLHNLLLDNAPVKVINQELMRSHNIYGIDNTDSIKKQYKDVFVKFDKYINKIGIFALPVKKYVESQSKISKYIISNEDKEKWRGIFQKFTFKKRNNIFLRGICYYYWLPPYIFADNRTTYEKWESQFTYSLEALNLIHQYHLLSFWSQLSIEEQLLILCILDHYKNSIYAVLNNIYRVSLDNQEGTSDDIFTHLDIITQECTDLYYSLILNKPDKDGIPRLLTHNKKIKITNVMEKYQPEQQGMRELDDPYIISFSILSLLKQIEIKKKQYDIVIDFPYGGTELGFAFISIFKLIYKDKKPPEVIHCLYSSKKMRRDPTIAAKKETTQWLFNFIPKYYHKKLEVLLKQKGGILLYDNNVTTFGSLAEIKRFFKDVYNITADGAVAAIYYSNISKYLLGKKSEPLISNWQKMLDYKPVTDYITAFNTWGTSRKGQIIESIFFNQKSSLAFNRQKHYFKSHF